MRLVLDASAIVAYVTDDRALSVRPYIVGDHELHVPAICDAEVVGGLSRQVRMGWLPDADAREALIDYVSMPLARHLHLQLIGRTYELSANFSATDASYLALAEALEADLVTVDVRFSRAVRELTHVPVLP